MKKIILVLLFLLIPLTAFCANEWKNADTDFLDGTTVLINDADNEVTDHIVEPLNRLLANYIQGATVAYNSAASIDVTSGSVVCKNSGATIYKMRQNTSTTNVTFSDIDTGSESSSTTYYLWASCDADATTFTVVISASSSAPSGVTSYALLGNFFNNSSSNIDQSKVYTTPYGFLRADSAGRGLVTDVRSFTTSTSSYTLKTGADLKVAYGGVSVGGNSTSSISNLPFESASTYSCSASFESTASFDDGYAGCTQSSGSALTITNQQGSTRTINWIAIGY